MINFKTILIALCGTAVAIAPAIAQARTDTGGPSDPYGESHGSYASSRPPELAAPRGYDGNYPPPPPPGYNAAASDPRQQEWDRHYAAQAEAWARDNCVKARGNATAGAVIGGIFGAVIGSGLQGRHDDGAGTLAGAALGAAGGAVIAGNSNSNETSLGCPPGYVANARAKPYSYSRPDYYYAAPSWYRPWVYRSGGWSYQPYPYHDWYYRNYRFHGPVYGPRGRRW